MLLASMSSIACGTRVTAVPPVVQPTGTPPVAQPDSRATPHDLPPPLLIEPQSEEALIETSAEDPPGEPNSPAADAAPDAFLLMDAPPRCPADMALVLNSVCIDRWEAALVQMHPGGVEKAWSPYRSIKDAKRPVRALSKAGQMPQGHISGIEGEQACQASGKRLCTAPEWEAACRGPKGTDYPYGSARKNKTCNDDGRPLHPVAEVTKRLGLPADRMWYEGMDHPHINQLDNTLRKAGERSECTNAIGTYDMVGNLHEWIEDPAGTFRGGFYMDTQINGEGCNYATTAHSKKYHDYSTGFRCCMDADSVE